MRFLTPKVKWLRETAIDLPEVVILTSDSARAEAQPTTAVSLFLCLLCTYYVHPTTVAYFTAHPK